LPPYPLPSSFKDVRPYRIPLVDVPRGREAGGGMLFLLEEGNGRGKRKEAFFQMAFPKDIKRRGTKFLASLH
uniref:hypothetical protein n=1 Tax=uncultured Bilophila sp. TaxID=529385 RepID=UPI0025E5FF41